MTATVTVYVCVVLILKNAETTGYNTYIISTNTLFCGNRCGNIYLEGITMKETYIKFRCTEEEKAIIEAMALKDKDSHNMSEYILGLVKKDSGTCRSVEIIANIMNTGKVKEKVSCGVYLFSEDGRASKDLYKKIEEIGNQIRKNKTDIIIYTSSEGEMLTTNVLSDECWLLK